MPTGGTPTPTASGFDMPTVPPWALSLQYGGRRASSGSLVAASHNGAGSSLLSLSDLSSRAQSGPVRASTRLSKVTNFASDEEEESRAATPNNATDLDVSQQDESDDTDAIITEGNSPEPARIMSDVMMMSLAQDEAADPEAHAQGQSEHNGVNESYASSSKIQALEGIWRKQHVLDEAAQRHTVDTAAGTRASKRRRISVSSDSSGSDIPAFLPKQPHDTRANRDDTATSRQSTSGAELSSPKRIRPGELNGRAFVFDGARLTEEDLQTALRANENRVRRLDHAGLAGSPQHDIGSSRAVSNTTAARRSAPKASILDESDDGSDLLYESDQEYHEDIEESTTITQSNKVVWTAPFSPNPNNTPEPLLTTTDGRLYSTLPDGTSKTNGSVFPTGYRLSNDPEYRFVCAVRDCQRLLPNVLSLGAHLGAKHCRHMFNDNLDGTMTFLGTYTKPKNSRSSSSPPIIISRNPPRPDEPEPALALVPANVKKRVEDQKLLAVKQVKKDAGGRSKKDNARLKGLAEQSRQYMEVTMKVPPKSASATPSASGDGRNDDLCQYLMSKLPSNAVLMTGGKMDELLQLPRLRSFPQGWKPLTMQRGLERISLTALLVYLTGDQLISGSCIHCSRVKGRACVVPHAGASKELQTSLKDGCAFCFYEAYCLHRRTWCSLLTNPGPDTRDPEQSSLAVPDSAVLDETMDSADLTPDARTRPARRAAIDAKAAINASASSQMPLSAGNVIPKSILEMEEWEIAPGRIRNDTGPVGENIAFSNSFVASTQEIPISSDVSFNVLTIKPGGSVQFQGHLGKLRVCSIAAGKIQVKTGPHDFAIGPNGMFKVLAGESAVITNRLYLDSVLHISSVKEY